MFGQYVKLVKAGEIVESNNYDPKTQRVEVKSKAGVSIVDRHEIVRITPDEEFEYLHR